MMLYMHSHSNNDSKTAAWLFCWHPYHWAWEKLALAIQCTAEGGSVTQRWHCNSQTIQIGDRAWLMRQGVAPQGIMAIGRVITLPYRALHYDKKRAQKDEQCWYVDIVFTQILDVFKDRFILLSELEELTRDKNFWTQSPSGISIEVDVAEQLNRLWEEQARNHSVSEQEGLSQKTSSPISSDKPESETSEPRATETAVSPVELSISQHRQHATNLIFYGPPGTGKTHALRQKQVLYKEQVSNKLKIYYEFVTFHQAYSYEDFVEGIRPVQSEKQGTLSYQLVSGVFKRLCEKARAQPDRRHAIFIDEINRGNIARIFGELITLIETDKRVVYSSDGHLLQGVELTLPYSGQRFGVPHNVDVYGSMNTADRSIAVLDAALRRRFIFKELLPNSQLVRGAQDTRVALPQGCIDDEQGGIIDLRALLDTINQRLGILLHRDMLLGHAYFYHIKQFSELKRVLLEQIIPLLQEYFYNDWHRLQLVFRDVGANQEAIEPQIIQHRILSAREILGCDVDDFNQIIDYQIVNFESLSPAAVRKVYASTS